MGNGEEISTELLINRAIQRGLTVQDLDKMSVGMIIDFLTVCQNDEICAIESSNKIYATQTDIDNF